jgi:hypothetical protein
VVYEKRGKVLYVRVLRAIYGMLEAALLVVEYCPTDDMTGDFHTKPLQGEKFLRFRNAIRGLEKNDPTEE